MLRILIAALTLTSGCTFRAERQAKLETEILINKLVEVSEIGYGYSPLSDGSQFLPQSDSEEVYTLVLGSEQPTKSITLEAIVRQGIHAVPSLLKHLDDARKTQIADVRGMGWTSFADEYDFNRRLRKEKSEGANQDMSSKNQPSSHTITVGDLCFVALGQILNRNFSATRYQPTGGLVVNSPTYSKRLRDILLSDWEGLTEQKHKELLIQDLLTPDHEYRRIGAYQRLAFYYPGEVEPLVVKQLRVPTFDAISIESFVRKQLYPERSESKRKASFDEFVKRNGAASSDGIVLRLFGDLEMQEADEKGRLQPPLKEKYDARALLILLYGYPKNVESRQVPFVNTWESAERARFIEALIHDKSVGIDVAVHGIFKNIEDYDYLALACMKRLIDRGYDDELKAYCMRRIRISKHYADELKAMLSRFD